MDPTYPDRSQWLTEIEAFAGARAYTSSELEELFLDACTLQRLSLTANTTITVRLYYHINSDWAKNKEYINKHVP